MNSSIKAIDFKNIVLPENFKNVAFLVLSDARMVRQKIVNPYTLAESMGIDVEHVEASHSKRGMIVNRNTNLHIKLNDNLSSLEAKFELALLISASILYHLNEELPCSYQITHIENEEKQKGNMFEASEKLAKLLLAFSFTKKELKLLKMSNAEKKLSNLAHKKGLPTRFLLQRLGEEMLI